MLSPSEFTVAKLTGAAHGALVIPHDKNFGSFLTLRLGQRGTFAVFLTGNERFGFFHYHASFDEDDAYFLKGVVIPKIAFEVDETSAFDPDSGNRILGSLVRTQERLEICVQNARQRIPSQSSLPIIEGLPKCETGSRAGFTRWRIVLGLGDDKRVLVAVNCLNGQELT